MSGVGMMLLANILELDVQMVTTGGSGTAPNQDRARGFVFGSLGSIVDGTSNIYSGSPILVLYWNENGGTSRFYQLSINGAPNSGWTTLNIGGQNFLRTSATSYGSGTWIWTTSDTISNQSFGSIGSTVTCKFT